MKFVYGIPHKLSLVSTMFMVSISAVQQASADIYQGETLVVTGTKTERKLLEVPVRTEIVTAAELENTHARDLAEGLKNVPGVLLKPIHGKSGQEIWLQGIDANRVLILIDGRPVTASTGSSVDLTQIAVADVHHIEIVKGAVSALYGSEAMGGVVNIITRRPTKPFAYKLTMDTGSYGSRNVGNTPFNDKHMNLVLSRNTESWYAQFMGDIRNKQGSDLDSSSWDFEGDAGDKYNLSAEIGYRFSNEAKLSVKPSYYREDLNKNFSSFVPGIGNIKKVKGEKATRRNIGVSFDTPILNDGKLSAWYMYEDFEDITSQDTVSTPQVDQQRVGESRFNKAEIQLDTMIGEYQLLTLGAVGFKSSLQQTQKRIQQNNSIGVDEMNGEKHRSNAEFYIQDDIFISDIFEVLPGLRYQHDSDFGGHAAPKLNMMVSPDWLEQDDLKFRFGIGSGYRVPTLKERHYVFDHSALGYMVLGNPDLVPETSISIQLGGEISRSKTFKADINLFYNDIKNLIATSLDPDESAATGMSIFKYSNIGKAKTQGVDISSGYAFTPALSGDLSYSYLDAINLETNKKLTRRPEHQVKLKLNYKFVNFKTDISLYGNYQSKEYIDSENRITSPGYSTFDLKINKDIYNGIKVFLGVDNLTDTVRSVPSSGQDFRPTTGRFIYMGVRFDG